MTPGTYFPSAVFPLFCPMRARNNNVLVKPNLLGQTHHLKEHQGEEISSPARQPQKGQANGNFFVGERL